MNRSRNVKDFESYPRRKKYKVMSADKDIMHFIREDANRNKKWQFNLKDVYMAYQELDDFATESFRKYIAIRHYPARGLLFALNMLVVCR